MRNSLLPRAGPGYGDRHPLYERPRACFALLLCCVLFSFDIFKLTIHYWGDSNFSHFQRERAFLCTYLYSAASGGCIRHQTCFYCIFFSQTVNILSSPFMTVHVLISQLAFVNRTELFVCIRNVSYIQSSSWCSCDALV